MAEKKRVLMLGTGNSAGSRMLEAIRAPAKETCPIMPGVGRSIHIGYREPARGLSGGPGFDGRPGGLVDVSIA